MEVEWESRTALPRSSHDWHDGPLPAPASPPHAPPSTFTSTPSLRTQRRRSSAAHTRPAVPPPNLPIPSVPGGSGSTIQHAPVPDYPEEPYPNGRDTRSSLLTRPTASANLVAVASFAESRYASTSHNTLVPIEATVEDLSDPPPRSFLPSSSSSSSSSSSRASETREEFTPSQELATDRLFPPPREPQAEPRVPSSRRALTRALELAREAVQLDTMNNNPEAAVKAYGRSVALLSEVMERVRRGEESTESRRKRRRRSVAAQEEEIRRLQNIVRVLQFFKDQIDLHALQHDTYADRMNILSIIYSIPAVPYSSSSMYSALTDSTTTLMLMSDSSTPLTPTRNSSPSPSPSSDSSPRIPQNSQVLHNIHNDYQLHPDEQATYEREFLGPEAVSSAMFPLGASGSGPPSTSHHPYANQYDPPQPPAISVAPLNRLSIVHRRARASSNLPPPPPPPSTSLPPAPTNVVVEPSTNTASSQWQPDGRTRHQSELAGHRKTGSSGLEVLTEEHDDGSPEGSRRTIDDSKGNPTPRSAHRDSHPLPPIPSPTTAVPGTPRNPLTPSKPPPSPRSSNIIVHRPRGTSQLTTRSEMANQPAFINPTTTQGTIFQRRTKTSVPPSSRSTSPADSIASAGSSPHPKSTTSSLPGITTIGPVPGRSRSSSQPGRRPSIVGGRISPLDPRPPLPGAASVTGSPMRKSSVPPKFNPSAQPSQLSIQTDLPPPQTGSSALSLVPPPAVFTNNLPTTPTSPLPQSPPTDPLLKPYYMMSLLRTTMISTTGGYVTRRLHVPHEVWSQGGAKLSNVLDKVRVVAILCSALEELQNSSSEHFGAGNVSSGLALGIGSIGRKEADAWLAKLEDFSSVCDGVVTNFGKKLGVGEGFVLKKTTWGDKLTRSFDKFTNGKK
jgi:hypothetical protein